MITKFSFYGFLLQTVLMTTLLAMNSNAQIRSVNDVYVSLQLKDARFDEVLEHIERQTNFVFVYTPGEINGKMMVNIQARNKRVSDVLMELSKQSQVKFKQVNQNISIQKLKPQESPAPVEVILQGFTVTGRVTEGNEPLPGVNVLIKGTSSGTVTDVNGRYSIEAPSANSVLVYSFVGYSSEEVSINNRSVIDVSLVQDIRALEEIVVVGYGVQQKSLVTGAISSVKAEELQTVSTSRIDQALQGRTSGVSITPTSGSPGAGTKIRIRGTSTNGNADPLFIIDGVRTGAAGMDYLSPNDVQSIEVLKDAASAAIYGAEGANGVIIVTTKSGRANVSEFTYSGQYGQQSVRPNIMQMMNPTQYQQYLTAAGAVGGPTAADAQAAGAGTNWLDEVFQTAPMQNHSLNFSGGTDRSTFFLSGNYFGQDGIVGGDKSQFNRYSFRINSSHQLKDWIKLGENLSYTNFQRKGFAEDSEFRSVLSSALAMDPLTPVVYRGSLPSHMVTLRNGENGHLLRTDANGNYWGISPYVTGEYGNPLAQIDLERTRTVQNKILGNIYLDLKPINGLTITSRLGIDAAFQRNHDWNPTFYLNTINLNTEANAFKAWDEWFTWQWEEFATYNRQLGLHNFTLLGGLSAQKFTHNFFNASYSGMFREEDIWSQPNHTARDLDQVGGDTETRTLQSLFGRLSYDFNNLYQFEATLRRDGSSMLAAGNQWGTFPSVSVGWIFTNEAFMPVAISDFINHGKVRASWGQNGSLSNLRSGRWMNTISTNVGGLIRYADANGNYVYGAAPTQLANPDLTWETSEQLNLGLDLAMWNDQLLFTVDYFNKTTIDLVTPGNPPGFAGLGMPFVNAGNVRNRGFEFELTYRSRPTSDFQYEISGNFTTVDNEVTDLSVSGVPPAGANVGTHWNQATAFTVGYPVWYFRGYKTDGLFESQEQITQYTNKYTGYSPQLGDPVIVDMNGDNQISPADYTMIGSPHAKVFYGARINLRYKGFDLLGFIQGQGGNDVALGFFRTDRGTANKPAFFFDERWTGPNSSSNGFRPTTSGNVYTSDLMIRRGSYARVRQLQFGYTLPAELTQNLGVRNVRAYVSLDNFFTFTNYPGLDPEAGSNNNNSIGIDRGFYPIPRTVLGGLTFSF
jgi:TonB-dependent starch-binding outer membrane protein SusC